MKPLLWYLKHTFTIIDYPVNLGTGNTKQYRKLIAFDFYQLKQMAHSSLAALSRQSNLFIAVSHFRGRILWRTQLTKVVLFGGLKGQAERVLLPKLDRLTSQNLSVYHQAVALKQSAKWMPFINWNRFHDIQVQYRVVLFNFKSQW